MPTSLSTVEIKVQKRSHQRKLRVPKKSVTRNTLVFGQGGLGFPVKVSNG